MSSLEADGAVAPEAVAPEAVPEPGPRAPQAALADDFVQELGSMPPLDPRDPDPYWALYVDRGLPLDPQAKAALALDMRSFSRRVFLPLLRPLARTALVLVGFFRIFVPNALTSSRLLHY